MGFSVQYITIVTLIAISCSSGSKSQISEVRLIPYVSILLEYKSHWLMNHWEGSYGARNLLPTACTALLTII